MMKDPWFSTMRIIMIDILIEPFTYNYMAKAIFISTLVGALCGFLSSYLMLKGWSLMGDALSHSVVPGVAGAYILGLPFSIGAFISGSLAALTMLFLNKETKLKEDAIIGNILVISDFDLIQLMIVSTISLLVLMFYWKDIMIVFFDETHSNTIGISPN